MNIYFREGYGRLYEDVEGGVCESFVYRGDQGCVHHMFIKREITDSGGYCDLITPYGYGGPIITDPEGETGKGAGALTESGRSRLVSEFKEAFSRYCLENRVVSEFIRFDPVTQNALDFKDMYSPEYNRHTLGTDLTKDDPVASEFTKNCRKKIRKAERGGITSEIVRGPSDLGSFKAIYYDTMDRDKAAGYYYFKDSYFENLRALLGEDLLLITAYCEDRPVAAGIYFIDRENSVLHVHLSGTLKEYLYLSPAYVLRHQLVLWGKEQGFRLVHHGGGASSSPDDSLYQFKKQFAGDCLLDFYIGRKIWDPEMYEELCRKRGVPEGTQFFPAYRAADSGRA